MKGLPPPGRTQLLAALAEARWVGSTLLIAKLGRLSRNTSFTLALGDLGVVLFAAICLTRIP